MRVVLVCGMSLYICMCWPVCCLLIFPDLEFWFYDYTLLESCVTVAVIVPVLWLQEQVCWCSRFVADLVAVIDIAVVANSVLRSEIDSFVPSLRVVVPVLYLHLLTDVL